MRNLILALFLCSSIAMFSQNSLKGRIINKDNIPLKGVNIYFDGTTIATISDEKGNFVIPYEPNANNVLVISFMGYQKAYFTRLDGNKPLNVSMSVAKNELKEIVIGNKELFTREQKLKLFREYFLGKTNNAKLAVITNEDDLHFKYDKQKLIFTASSDKPLNVINTSLGYKINFELVSFEVAFEKLSISPRDVTKYIYKGESRFEEIDSSAEVLVRREKAYQGSQLQFFRNFADNDWASDKFLLFDEDYGLDPAELFRITKEEGFVKVDVLPQQKRQVKLKDIDIKAKGVEYNITFNNREGSKVIFQTDSFRIYKYGNNSNLENILFLGRISEKRIGDMLPLNYGIN